MLPAVRRKKGLPKKLIIAIVFAVICLSRLRKPTLEETSRKHVVESGNHSGRKNSRVHVEPETTRITVEAKNQDVGGKHIGMRWRSSKSVVIGLAAGYGLQTYTLFVGSLRATGYNGHIILGISPDAPKDVREYLAENNVIAKDVKISRCTYYNTSQHDGRPSTGQKCSEEYPDYKIQWGRFAHSRDWLKECEDCTDGVILTDTRDAYFQSDPFATVVEAQNAPIMVFEEHAELTNDHWLTGGPVKQCRNYTIGAKPMLCSGSVMGSREGILDYLNSMVEEFDFWKDKVRCRSDMVGDDQSIHNYLYYSGKLKDAVAIPHRTGPIHVVGYQADKIFRATIREAFEAGHGKDIYEAEGWVNSRRFMGTNESNWRDSVPAKHHLTDPNTGLILNLDGTPSAQVHQYDRFGPAFDIWLNRMSSEVWEKNK